MAISSASSIRFGIVGLDVRRNAYSAIPLIPRSRGLRQRVKRRGSGELIACLRYDFEHGRRRGWRRVRTWTGIAVFDLDDGIDLVEPMAEPVGIFGSDRRLSSAFVLQLFRFALAPITTHLFGMRFAV